MEFEEKIRELHLELAEKRGADATYCPSELAKMIDPDNWRSSMEIVREVADGLIEKERLVLMQKGKMVEGKATDATGPIRLRIKN